MGKSHEWWAVIKGGKSRQTRIYKHEEEVREKYAPIVSIQRAGIRKDGERQAVFLNIWELDRGIKRPEANKLIHSQRYEETEDDLVASFAGEILCKTTSQGKRKWYFIPYDKQQLNERLGETDNPVVYEQDHVGPEFSIRFESPGEDTLTDPWLFKIQGDDTENKVWELGLEVFPYHASSNRQHDPIHRTSGKPTSRSHYPVIVDGWTSYATKGDLRTQCLAKITSMTERLDSLRDEWIKHFKLTALAYKNAYKKVEKTVKRQQEIDAAWREVYVHLAFGIASSLLSGGLSMLSTGLHKSTTGRMKKVSEWIMESGSREIWFEGAEDALQTMVGKGIEAAEIKYLDYTKDTKKPRPRVNIDPDQFEVDIENAVRDDFADFKNWISDVVKTKIGEHKTIDDFKPSDVDDLESKINNWMADKKYVGGTPKQVRYNDPTHKTANLQDDWEIALWAEWVKSSLKKRVKVPTDYEYRYGLGEIPTSYKYETVYKDPGGHIEKRLTFLGISDEAQITENKKGKAEDWGWPTREWEVRRLVTWAEKYVPPNKYG